MSSPLIEEEVQDQLERVRVQTTDTIATHLRSVILPLYGGPTGDHALTRLGYDYGIEVADLAFLLRDEGSPLPILSLLAIAIKLRLRATISLL